MEQRRVAFELESTKEKEAIELEALKLRHQREEDDAEEEDERHSVNGSDRVDAWLASNADARSSDRSPPRSPRHVTSPSASYHSLAPSPSPFEANVAAGGAKVRPAPETRTAPVAKTTPATKGAPVTETTPNPSPSTRAAASKPPKRITTPAADFTCAFNDAASDGAGSVTAPTAKKLEVPAPSKCPSEMDAALPSGYGKRDPALTLIDLQAQQFAYQYLVSLRPKKPFDGEGTEIDFEHYLRKFEVAIHTPGLSAALRLSEIPNGS